MPTAKTSKLDHHLHKIPFAALKRIGSRFKTGDERHGRDNWKYGVDDKDFQEERANHALAHLLEHIDCLMSGRQETDDNLAAVAWYCCVMMEFEKDTTYPQNGRVMSYEGHNGIPSTQQQDAIVGEYFNADAPTHAALHDREFTITSFASLSPAQQALVREGTRPGIECWLYDDRGDQEIKHVRPRPDEKASLVVDIPA
jgi:hypothetical protein